MTATVPVAGDRVAQLLTEFKLTTAADQMARRFLDAGCDQGLVVLAEVLEVEAQARRERRVDRLRRASHLPPAKTFEALDEERVPRSVLVKARDLARGAFVERAENVLLFGKPGVGKSHVACALGHALVDSGVSVWFTPAFQLVQQLLAARRDLALPRALRALDAFDVVILDDLGYVQQTPDEAEVLFTLMAERYERRSLILTSNLVFSEWDRIFKNPMTTAAAIDRLVHHATILEIDRTSVRAEDAKLRKEGHQPNDNSPTSTTKNRRRQLPNQPRKR
ncbi:MAG: ATP-binding protein [Myxococcales bacterium]|nr:ATP-binding protein [Myxococcales bacterium]